MKDFDERPGTRELLEENTGKTLRDTDTGKTS